MAGKIKTINADELLKKQMKDPEFKKEYNMLDKEFTIAREIIKLRLAANMTQKKLAERSGNSF
jgi:hypothetical protein